MNFAVGIMVPHSNYKEMLDRINIYSSLGYTISVHNEHDFLNTVLVAVAVEHRTIVVVPIKDHI